MKRTAKAVWQGNLKEGQGELSSQSGILHESPYSFQTRFGESLGTNPEELIAAAHAGCFSMALAHELAQSGIASGQIKTEAKVQLLQIAERWTINLIELDVRASLRGAHSAAFYSAVNRAKENCPVSRLVNAQVIVNAQLIDKERLEHAEVVIYTSTHCHLCSSAKSLLEEQGVEYCEIDLDEEPADFAADIKSRTGRMSVPQIFVGGQFIGDYEDLVRLEKDHGLQKLLKPRYEAA